MAKQCFTFGCGQTFANGYVVIEAESAERCREIMMESFGARWSMQYDYDHIDELKKYGMTKLCTIFENERVRRCITENQIFVS